MFLCKFFLGLAVFFLLALVASATLAAQYRFESRVYYRLAASFFLLIFFFIGIAVLSLLFHFLLLP